MKVLLAFGLVFLAACLPLPALAQAPGDVLHRHGFEGCSVGALSRQEARDVLSALVDGREVCVPPHQYDLSGTPVFMCTGNECAGEMPGCPMVLRLQSLVDTLDTTASYELAGTIDDFTMAGTCEVSISAAQFGTDVAFFNTRTGEAMLLTGLHSMEVVVHSYGQEIDTSTTLCVFFEQSLALSVDPIEAAIEDALETAITANLVGETVCPLVEPASINRHSAE